MDDMPRWEPDARERLVVAAVQLFSEQGYDETTVAQIAHRANVTSSTFHRHFPDKRDVLAAGQETVSKLLAEGIGDAPAGASPLEAVAEGLSLAASAYKPERSSLIAAAVAASAELQERAALKQAGTSAAIAEALIARGVAEPLARLAAELGGLALKGGFAAWVASGASEDLGQLMRAELARLRQTATEL
jgi:AcrR family transcriptional regulator